MLRNTNQRRAIKKAFEEAGRPLGPQEVLDIAGKHAPGLGIATVYRTLKGMLDDGTLSPVPIPGEPTRYELAGQSHSAYFMDKKSKKVHGLDGNVAGALRSLVPRGFKMEGHHVFIYGRAERAK